MSHESIESLAVARLAQVAAGDGVDLDLRRSIGYIVDGVGRGYTLWWAADELGLLRLRLRLRWRSSLPMLSPALDAELLAVAEMLDKELRAAELVAAAMDGLHAELAE